MRADAGLHHLLGRLRSVSRLLPELVVGRLLGLHGVIFVVHGAFS